VSHLDDGYVCHMLVKCSGSSVKFGIYFGFMLFLQPDM
jgi:hypothetical protein